MILSGWGRTTPQACRVSRPRSEAELAARVAEGGLIARGAGRAYGDAAQSAANTVDMGGVNRMIRFDADSGQLVAEAGVWLADVIATFLPRGWFPAVTPGTRFVTLGGAVAADVHGKNHHREGSFGAFVDWIDLMGPDGTVRRLTPGDDLFRWTLGGMGLTGVILRVALRLRRVETGWIAQRTVVAPDLAAAMAAFEGNADALYSVAWIDCLAQGAALGRSLVMLGEHASVAALPGVRREHPFTVPARPRRALPFDAPGFALNPLTVRAFNEVYWQLGKRKAGPALVPWDAYFYPLDAIGNWNRIYGRRGFVQFQCALPLASSADALHELLKVVSASGQGSFLAVLKRFGPQAAPFAFPMEGYTLALDFPLHGQTSALLDRLDRIVVAAGGRFYLAKDARMSRETLWQADPRAAAFVELRDRLGLRAAFASTQSERLGL
ncbi:MAG: FAD-binding protein [Rhodobacteraceae bacterium]|nr:FAD-binding protein [Paracoccaceae bacterium]